MTFKLKSYWKTQPALVAFVFIGLVFGLLFLVLNPPTQVADETTHFYRAYEFSEGHLFARKIGYKAYGDYLPKDVLSVSQKLFANIPSHHDRKFNYHQLPGLLKQRINFKQTTAVHIEGAAVYSPAGYIPQILSIDLAKFIWPSVTLMYYLGRIANLLLWLVLVAVAIRIWPGNKWAVFALALIPMSLAQAASFSPDATINGLAFLIVSTAYYWAKRPKKLSRREMIMAYLAVVIISLCKPIFFIFGLLGFMIGSKKFVSRRQYLLFGSGLVAIGLVLTALWSAHVNIYNSAIQYLYYNGQHISQSQQISSIFHRPWHFVNVLVNTFLSSNGNIITTSFIGRLGWWDVDLPIWLVTLAYGLLVLSMLGSDETEDKTSFTKLQRWFGLSGFILGVLAISGVLYLTISAVNAPQIAGIQGRYFIAFAPLLLPAFAGYLKIKNWNKIASRVYPLSYAMMLSISLVILVNRFV